MLSLLAVSVTVSSPVGCVNTEVGSGQLNGRNPRGQRIPRDPLGPFKEARLHSHLQPAVLLQTCGYKKCPMKCRLRRNGDMTQVNVEELHLLSPFRMFCAVCTQRRDGEQ